MIHSGDLCRVDRDYDHNWLYLYPAIIVGKDGYIRNVIYEAEGLNGNILDDRDVGFVVVNGLKESPDDVSLAFVVSPKAIGWVEAHYLEKIEHKT